MDRFLNIKDINISECLRRNAKRRKRNRRKFYSPVDKPDWFVDQYRPSNLLGFKFFFSNEKKKNKLIILLSPFIFVASGWGGKVSFMRNYSTRLVDIAFIVITGAAVAFFFVFYFLLDLPYGSGSGFGGFQVDEKIDVIIRPFIMILALYAGLQAASVSVYIVYIKIISMYRCLRAR